MNIIKSKRSGSIIFNFLNYTVFTLITLLCIYPFWFILIYSLSDPAQAMKGLTLLPVDITLNSYENVLKINAIFNSSIVSLSRTVVGTLITLVCCSFFAYLLTKQKLPLRKTIYRFMIITMYFNAGLIPYYLTIRSYDLINRFAVYVIPSALSAFYVVLVKTYIESLPKSLLEAAKLDGAGFIKIYYLIIVPLSKPILATIAVFAAVNQWNNWFDNYLFVSNKELRTLQYLLYTYLTQAEAIAASMKETGTAGLGAIQNSMSNNPQTIRMTLTMVVVFPILLVYPFCQKYFTKGIMIGAIKG